MNIRYVGLDGVTYSSADEKGKADRAVKSSPIYVKEMTRRRMMNIPGEITRDEWQKLVKENGIEAEIQQQPNYVDRFESERPNVRTVTPEEIKEGMKKVLRKSVDEAVKDPQFVKDMDDLMEGRTVKKSIVNPVKSNSELTEEMNEMVESKAGKRPYKFSIPDTYKSVMKSAAKKGIPFDLNILQVESLMEKRCHFCSHESEKIITLGDRFDYKDSKAVCGMCKQAHDLFGPELTPWLDRFVK